MSKGKIALAGLAALLLTVAGLELFAWKVDEGSFASRGWKADTDAALAAAKVSGRPVFVKLGSHG
ncbi:MAG TPA: hypothetical protein VHF22_00745 [Planctomycetota bacterium]|nr:hypothetical protein [Planctomycetota bacterium]